MPCRSTSRRAGRTRRFNVHGHALEHHVVQPFTNTTNVGGLAGISYPSAWPGSAQLGCAQSDALDLQRAPRGRERAREERLSLSNSYSGPFSKHQLRFGADFRHDASSAQTNGNARGAFTFTGLYTSQGAQTSRGTGADFADFLLGCRSRRRCRSAADTLRENAFDAYIDDNWQKSAKLTLNLGLRYELSMPYIEASTARWRTSM